MTKAEVRNDAKLVIAEACSGALTQTQAVQDIMILVDAACADAVNAADDKWTKRLARSTAQLAKAKEKAAKVGSKKTKAAREQAYTAHGE